MSSIIVEEASKSSQRNLFYTIKYTDSCYFHYTITITIIFTVELLQSRHENNLFPLEMEASEEEWINYEIHRLND